VTDKPPILLGTAALNRELETLIGGAEELAAEAQASNTRRAYDRQWAAFEAWCRARGLGAELPVEPAAVAMYVSYLVDLRRSMSTIQQAMAAIADRHRHAGTGSPTGHPQIQLILQGARRRRGVAAEHQARPLLPDDLRARIRPLIDTGRLRGARDLALLSFGLAAALRRSEFCGLRLSQLERVKRGFLVRLAHTKSDQEGRGHERLITHGAHADVCPVRAMDEWISRSGIDSGTVLRCVHRQDRAIEKPLDDDTLNWIVRDYTRRAGMGDGYSGHSLRAGYITAAHRAGKDAVAIQRHVGHRSPKSTAIYIRHADVLDSTATKDIGL